MEPQRILPDGLPGAAELYVALTRATQRLGVLHHGSLPQALTGLAETGTPRSEINGWRSDATTLASMQQLQHLRRLVVNERHRRQILTIPCTISTPGGRTERLPTGTDSSRYPAPSAINLADYQVRRKAILDGLITSIRSQHDRTDTHKPEGQAQNPIFKPHSVGEKP